MTSRAILLLRPLSRPEKNEAVADASIMISGSAVDASGIAHRPDRSVRHPMRGVLRCVRECNASADGGGS
jgi:hypothetical protein